MKLDTTSWHWKVFAWQYEQQHCYPFPLDDVDKRSVNLCPYMRRVLIWATIWFLFSPPGIYYTAATLLLAGTGVNYHFHGWHGLSIEGQVLGAFACVCLGAFALFLTGAVIKSSYKKWKDIQRAKRGYYIPPKPDGFFKLLGQWFKARHDSICPAIEITGPEIEELDRKRAEYKAQRAAERERYNAAFAKQTAAWAEANRLAELAKTTENAEVVDLSSSTPDTITGEPEKENGPEQG